jgi:hypothetical protein
MVYELAAFRDNRTTVATWEIAVCKHVRTRSAALSVTNEEEHVLAQTVTVAGRFQEALELRGRRAADVVDWSAFASRSAPTPDNSSTDVRRALLLAQTIEALVRTLESYPVEVVAKRRDGPVVLRAQDESDRDAFAKTIGLGGTADALSRMFDDDQRDPAVAWRLSRSPGLGSSSSRDIGVHFVGVAENRSGYEFEAERDLAIGDVYFLRSDRELGTEQVIRRARLSAQPRRFFPACVPSSRRRSWTSGSTLGPFASWSRTGKTWSGPAWRVFDARRCELPTRG